MSATGPAQVITHDQHRIYAWGTWEVLYHARPGENLIMHEDHVRAIEELSAQIGRPVVHADSVPQDELGVHSMRNMDKDWKAEFTRVPELPYAAGLDAYIDLMTPIYTSAELEDTTARDVMTRLGCLDEHDAAIRSWTAHAEALGSPESDSKGS